MGDVAKQLGAAWSQELPESKAKYEAMAEEDKARYQKVSKKNFSLLRKIHYTANFVLFYFILF